MINKIWNYVLSLFQWNKARRTISVATTACIAGKSGAIGTVTSGVFKGYINSMWTFKSKLLQRASSLTSALSSVGGLIALFLDFGDKSWDDWITIRY